LPPRPSLDGKTLPTTSSTDARDERHLTLAGNTAS
jgi:hypothetical protein